MKYQNCKSKSVQDMFDEVLLDNAFTFYATANDIPINRETKNKFYNFHVPVENDSEKILKEISVGVKVKAKEDFRIMLCNQIVRSNDFTNSLKGKSSLGDRQQTFERIKDVSSKVKNLDMIVMAELALPSSTLHDFCMHSAKQQIAVVSGIEFLTVKDISYNFIITILPVTIDGTKDSVPIIRLKNDYTHSEIELVNGVEGGYYVPELPRYINHLYRWKGFAFSTYYCFELANITMRNVFFSLLDFMVVPVWNKDTHYFNALAEATARDLHCYYVQVNTSEYGDTRIIEPVSSVKSDLARIKGGTINDPDFRVTFLVSDLKIGALREAQLLSFSLNKDKTHNHYQFKPLPPNWPFENVKKRKNNERLL